MYIMLFFKKILWTGYLSLLLSLHLAYLQQTKSSQTYRPPDNSTSSQAITRLCSYIIIWISKNILNKTGDPTYTVTLLRP